MREMQGRRLRVWRRAPQATPSASPDPPSGPRLVAEPDRSVLLDPAAQGGDPQRPRDARRARRPATGLRRALPPDRATVRVDLHPPRPRRATRPDRPPRAAPRARCLTIWFAGTLSRLGPRTERSTGIVRAEQGCRARRVRGLEQR